MREWNAKNAERLREEARERWKNDPEYRERKKKKAKKSYIKHREACLLRSAKYQWANRDKYLAYQKAYAKKNAKKAAERARLWKLSNPARAKANAVESASRRRTKMAGGDAYGCAKLIREWKAEKYFDCAGCGRSWVTKNALHVDHILPLSRGGDHAPYNLQRLCVECNLRKAASDDCVPNLGR